MNDIIAGIGIFLLGILATIGAIWGLQVASSRQSKPAGKADTLQVTPEEFILEHLQGKLPELTAAELVEAKKVLRKRYRMSKAEADEILTGVIRSRAFERITGARCTCYAESKQYGKYFHAPSCEYRRFLEERGRE